MNKTLTNEHKIVLYRIAIRQDEQGRQPTYLKAAQLEANDLYQDLLESQYLTYEQFGEGEKAIASLMVTLKGLRYCTDNIDEISALDRSSRPQF